MKNTVDTVLVLGMTGTVLAYGIGVSLDDLSAGKNCVGTCLVPGTLGLVRLMSVVEMLATRMESEGCRVAS